MINQNTISAIQKYFQPHLLAVKRVPPALSAGLSVFMVLLYLASFVWPSMNESLRLQTSTLTSLERTLISSALFLRTLC